MSQKIALVLTAAFALVSTAQAQPLAGKWDGVVKYGDNSFPFVFEIVRPHPTGYTDTFETKYGGNDRS